MNRGARRQGETNGEGEKQRQIVRDTDRDKHKESQTGSHRKVTLPLHSLVLTPVGQGPIPTNPSHLHSRKTGKLRQGPQVPVPHTLTGPQSETVHWRSQGGPVQFFSPTGRVLGSQSSSSSEQRMSLVTTLRSPHLAVHWRGQAMGTHAGPTCCPPASHRSPHLGPLGHLPLRPAGWVAARLALLGPHGLGGLAQVTVHGAVEAGGQHLPAAHDAGLVALAACA